MERLGKKKRKNEGNSERISDKKQAKVQVEAPSFIFSSLLQDLKLEVLLFVHPCQDFYSTSLVCKEWRDLLRNSKKYWEQWYFLMFPWDKPSNLQWEEMKQQIQERVALAFYCPQKILDIEQNSFTEMITEISQNYAIDLFFTADALYLLNEAATDHLLEFTHSKVPIKAISAQTEIEEEEEDEEEEGEEDKSDLDYKFEEEQLNEEEIDLEENFVANEDEETWKKCCSDTPTIDDCLSKNQYDGGNEWHQIITFEFNACVEDLKENSCKVHVKEGLAFLEQKDRLIKELPKGMNERDFNGRTPLMLAVQYWMELYNPTPWSKTTNSTKKTLSSLENTIQVLLKAGADPNIPDYRGVSPLIVCKYECRILETIDDWDYPEYRRIIKLLIEHGANTFYIDSRGRYYEISNDQADEQS